MIKMPTRYTYFGFVFKSLVNEGENKFKKNRNNEQQQNPHRS